MFNIHILKKHFKSNTILWIVLMLIPALMVIVTAIAMISTTSEGQIAPISIVLQTGIFMSVGWQVPFIFLVVASNRIVVNEVQSGSITYVIVSNVSRREIIITKINFIILSILIAYLVNLVLTAPIIALNQEVLDISVGAYIVQLTGLFIFLFCIAGMTFIASCYFNKSLWSLSIGVGLPLVFYLLFMLGSIDPSLKFLQYLSITTLFGNANIFSNQGNNVVLNNVGSWITNYLILILLGTSMFIGSGIIFCKKDLPL